MNMAGSHKPVEIDKDTLESAHRMWDAFVSYGKLGIIIVAVTLILMALFLL